MGIAGASASKIVFAGVGKTEDEMRRAIATGPVIFNVESGEELRVLATLAKEARATVPFALRVNPDVDPRTHTYISTGKRENKFGVDLPSAERIARDALTAGMRGAVALSGIHVHIGSQILDPAPYRAAVERAAAFAAACRAMGHGVEFLNVGGGFGIDYAAAESLPFDGFAAAIRGALPDPSIRLLLEPGRSLVANAGALLATVVRVKRSGDRRFVIVDAAMNDLIRPSLYQAHHKIVPVVARPGEESPCDVVGPICESGDFLALDRKLPPLEAGDRVAVLSAGAYGFSMSSQYNTRRRAAEVLIEGGSARVIRARETYEEMLENESRFLLS